MKASSGRAYFVDTLRVGRDGPSEEIKRGRGGRDDVSVMGGRRLISLLRDQTPKERRTDRLNERLRLLDGHWHVNGQECFQDAR